MQMINTSKKPAEFLVEIKKAFRTVYAGLKEQVGHNKKNESALVTKIIGKTNFKNNGKV
jgi:hypothetical protein